MSTQPERKSTKAPRIHSQRVRVKSETGKIRIGGWISPERRSYLRFEVASDPTVIDFLDGYSLYRLAKAIVRRWEN